MVHDRKLAKIWKQVFKKLNSLCENINHYFSYKLTHAIHGYDIFQKYLALHGHVFESKEVTHSSGKMVHVLWKRCLYKFFLQLSHIKLYMSRQMYPTFIKTCTCIANAMENKIFKVKNI